MLAVVRDGLARGIYPLSHDATPDRPMSNMIYEGRDLEVLADMPNYYGWIMSWFAPYVRGRVVEYGSGAGTVSKLLRPLADRLTLVEPSANLLPLLQARFPRDPAVEIGQAMLEEHSRRLPDGAMDTAVLVNVLEHIEDDRRALAELSRILAPGGHLLIFVPALPALMSKIDRIHGHFRRYLRRELRMKLEAAGAEPLTCRHFDLPGVVPWFLINKLLGSTSFNPTLLKIYDGAVVPLARGVEAIVIPPLGKNLIAIARKR
jgi:SAM-dependent methyltransferase